MGFRVYSESEYIKTCFVQCHDVNGSLSSLPDLDKPATVITNGVVRSPFLVVGRDGRRCSIRYLLRRIHQNKKRRKGITRRKNPINDDFYFVVFLAKVDWSGKEIVTQTFSFPRLEKFQTPLERRKT